MERMAELKLALAQEAQRQGFADFGITQPEAVRQAGQRLRRWVGRGAHGEMSYMADRLDWRSDPAALWPEARSVIMLAEPYGDGDDPLALLGRKDRGAISIYARNRDYHDLVKKRLKRLGRWLIERAAADGAAPEIKVFVDTAPVMEKPLAAAAGLGWQGKHTNVVSRQLGSWFFLGAIFTTLELPADEAHEDHCGGCRRCLDICPTAAFSAPYQLDARRCISYLTIELKGQIPAAMRPLIGNRIYGCDDCLAVCPWNKFASLASEVGYWRRPELAQPRLADLASLDDASFRTVFSGSPIKRIGLDRFQRNVAIAIGNSGDEALIEAAVLLIETGGALTRGAAVWALARLDHARAAREAGQRKPAEPDVEVQAEWEAVLSA